MRERIADLLRFDFDMIAFAADGQQAIESALQLKPDIVVLDISMPVLNGLQVASHLHDQGCPAKLIFLTVHRDPDIVEAAFSAGAFGYVFKPLIEGSDSCDTRSTGRAKVYFSQMTRIRTLRAAH